MATLLEQYRNKQSEAASQIAQSSLPPDSLPIMQELNYRICVLETLQSFCKAAPITVDVQVMAYHYQLVDAYINFLLSERKFGLKTDDEGLKKRKTAESLFERVILDNKKRFSSFKPETQQQYKRSIVELVNTILPVWVQYRNTYINF